MQALSFIHCTRICAHNLGAASAVCLGLLAFVGALYAGSVNAAVPRRGLALVAINMNDAPETRTAVNALSQYAIKRLRLNPSKVVSIDTPPNGSELLRIFRQGEVFQRVSHDDVVLIYLAGAQMDSRGLVIGGNSFSFDTLFRLRNTLREGPGKDLGFFEGRFVFVVQGNVPKNLRMPKDVALLNIDGNNDPIDLGMYQDGDRPEWTGAHEVLEGRGVIERGLLSFVAAFEAMVANPSIKNRSTDLPALINGVSKTSKQRARMQAGANWSDDDPALLMESVQVALYPRLLKNQETQRVLSALQIEIQHSVPEELKGRVNVRVLDKADPTADVRCQVVANEEKAHVECVEQRAPIFSDWVTTVELDAALAPVVKQVLRNYKALTQTDWSKNTRRDLRPLDIYALIDTSLSMAYHDPTSITDPELKEGPSKRETFLVRLASAVSEHADRTKRPARLTVILFGENLVPLRMPQSTNGTVTLVKQLTPSQLNAYGASFRMLAKSQRYTGIEKALTETALRMAEVNTEVTRHVLLLTDGKENLNRADPRGSVRRAARSVRMMGATLDVIGLSEMNGRLPNYLQRMQAGGEVLRRYIQLIDMTFAPPACRSSKDWSTAVSKQCGQFYAKQIRKGEGYDPALLDEVRRSREPGVPTGMFLQPQTPGEFQDQLQVLVSSIVGKGIYASKSAQRKTDETGRITDQWELKLNVSGRAKVVLYNQDQLRDLRFRVTKDGQPLTESDHLLITRESDSTTVVTLPRPARGTFRIERSGVPQ